MIIDVPSEMTRRDLFRGGLLPSNRTTHLYLVDVPGTADNPHALLDQRPSHGRSNPHRSPGNEGHPAFPPLHLPRAVSAGAGRRTNRSRTSPPSPDYLIRAVAKVTRSVRDTFRRRDAAVSSRCAQHSRAAAGQGV